MTKKSSHKEFIKGFKDGLPIGLGYLSVSFGFGIMAVSQGLPLIWAVIISMTNLTSAGQVAGISVISQSGGCLEMALAQLVINARYALMGLSLSQKLDEKFNLRRRLAVSFGITDEIFAVASGKSGDVSPCYMYGLISLPFVCWSSGTLLGGLAGGILPPLLKGALGIMIYGMFIAIVVPSAAKSKGVFLAAAVGITFSCLIKYIPLFKGVSDGFAIIISALAGAAAAALIFPIETEKGGAENE